MAIPPGTGFGLDREFLPRRTRPRRPPPPPRPVQGENAREKARVPVVDAARRTVDAVIDGRIDTRKAASALHGLKLTEPEKRDVERYSASKSQRFRSGEQIVGTVVGSQLAKLLPGGTSAREADPKWAAFELALLAPGTLIGKPVAGTVRGARALRGPKAEAVRTFRANDLEVTVPAARSRTGRAVERGIDKARPALVKAGLAKTGLVKTEEQKAGLELKRLDEARAKIETAPAMALERVGRKLNPAEQVALRVVAEGVKSGERAAFHAEQAKEAKNRRNLLYHGIHESLLRGAARFLDETGATPRLRDDAPARLKDAWRLLENTAGTREDIYRGLGRLTEERIAQRLSAPGRVFKGARYETPTAAKLGKASDALTRARRRVISLERRYETALRLTRAKAGPAERVRVITGLRAQRLKSLPEAAFRQQYVEKAPGPKTPGIPSDMPAPGTYTETVKRLGAALSVARDELQSLERAAAARVKPTGLVGGEGFEGGRAYVGYQRGIPGMSLRSLGAVASGARRAFTAGSRRAVAGGARDDALTNEFTGKSILSGRFSTDTTGTVAKGLQTASRLSRGAAMRDSLLRASTETVRRADDVAIREDAFLGKRLPEQLKRLWDEMEAVRAGEQGAAGSRRAQEIEDRISAAIRAELTPDVSPAAGKVKGVRWVSRDFADAAGLMEVPGATKLQVRGWMTLARAARQTPVVALDAVNDLMRAAVLYLNPAYAPVQLTQNAIMLAAGQGPLAVAKLPRAWRLSTELPAEDLVKVDSLMQLDRLYEARQSRLITQKVTDPFARFATMFADLGPRRAAFLNEAAAAGHGTPAALQNLLNDSAKLQELKRISDRANRVMGDFDKLSEFERQYMGRIFWFWPWTHVAFQYTARFPLDHPALAAGVVAGDRKLQERADEQLGDRPYYGRNYQKIGEREGLPRIVNTGPLTPFTTPVEFGQAWFGFVTGRKDVPQLADKLTPALFGTGRSLFGAPYGGKQGLPAMIEPFTDVPLRNRVDELRKDDTERAQDAEERLRPRTFREAVGQLVAGPLAPSGYNPKVGQARAAALAADNHSPTERAVRKVFDERERFYIEAKRLFPADLENGRLPKELRDAFNRKADRQRSYAAADLRRGSDDYQHRAAAVDLELFARWGLATRSELAEARAFIARASESEVGQLRRRWSNDGGPFHTAYLGVVGNARRALEAKGANLD